MAELILRAEPRSVLGKKVKTLRRAGLVPGVVYGPVLDGTVSVSVNQREFERFYTRAGHSTLFTLRWEGGEQPVVIREVQLDPVKRTPLHIDFFAPNLRQALTAAVPLTFHNEPSIAETTLTHQLNELQVSALPASIPQHVEVDLSALAAAGDSVRAGDIALPSGVELVTPADDIVAILSAAVAIEEPEVEEVADEAAAPTDEDQVEAAEAASEGSESESDS